MNLNLSLIIRGLWVFDPHHFGGSPWTQAMLLFGMLSSACLHTQRVSLAALRWGFAHQPNPDVIRLKSELRFHFKS
jgi:hypothetical protein